MIGICELYITGGNVDPCLEVWTYKEEGKRLLTRDNRPHGLINVAHTKKLTGEVHGQDGAGEPKPAVAHVQVRSANGRMELQLVSRQIL